MTSDPKPDKVLDTRALYNAIAELDDYKERRGIIVSNLEIAAQTLSHAAIRGLSGHPREDVRPVQGIAYDALKALFLAQEQRLYLDLTRAIAEVMDGATRIE